MQHIAIVRSVGQSELNWAGQTRVRVGLDVGGVSGRARLDLYFRKRLGDMTHERVELIRATKPETVTVRTRQFRDTWNFDKERTLYLIERTDLDAWLLRVRDLQKVQDERKPKVVIRRAATGETVRPTP